MATARQLLSIFVVVTLVGCSSEDVGDPMKIAPQPLLTELQKAARNAGGTCRLERNEDGADERIERLLRATAADIVSIEKPAYVVEPAVEVVIRAPELRAPLLSVLVYVGDGHCERFDLADIKDENASSRQ